MDLLLASRPLTAQFHAISQRHTLVDIDARKSKPGEILLLPLNSDRDEIRTSPTDSVFIFSMDADIQQQELMEFDKRIIDLDPEDLMENNRTVNSIFHTKNNRNIDALKGMASSKIESIRTFAYKKLVDFNERNVLNEVIRFLIKKNQINDLISMLENVHKTEFLRGILQNLHTHNRAQEIQDLKKFAR